MMNLYLVFRPVGETVKLLILIITPFVSADIRTEVLEDVLPVNVLTWLYDPDSST